MAWGFGGARGELGRRLGVEVRAAAMASGSGVAVLASARPDGDAMGGASINVADAAEEGGDGTAWRGRVALGMRERRRGQFVHGDHTRRGESYTCGLIFLTQFEFSNLV